MSDGELSFTTVIQFDALHRSQLPRLSYFAAIFIFQFSTGCPRPPLLLSPASQATSSYCSFDLDINKRLIGEGKEWEKGEKETGSAAYARTGTMPLDPSVTDVSSLVFSLTPKLLLIPNGFLVLVIGSALVSLYFFLF